MVKSDYTAMKVLFISSEMYPLAKVGGLGDVIGSLPKALRNIGVDARVVMPKYDFINNNFKKIGERSFRFGDVKIYMTNVRDVPVYLLEINNIFEGEIYKKNDWKRWLLFSRVAVHVPLLIDFEPDIVHINDWMTAPVAAYIKNCKYHWKIVLTIHNLRHQGSFPLDIISHLGVGTPIQNTFIHNDGVNYLKSAIQLSDAITTVSPNYAKEILTPEYGEGLDKILRKYRHKVVGILNGIDYDVWNPETDPFIFRNYDPRNLEKKWENKEKLCKYLNCDLSKPLFGFIARLVEQKGVDILIKALSSFDDANFIILGTGREKYERALKKLGEEKQNVKPIIKYDERLAHQIYAAADFFLMPSKFEPCGLGQMIAMRYGTIPIVRATGGLKDTVKDVKQGGWGITFSAYSARALKNALKRAVEIYRKSVARDIAIKAMELDFSWNRSAREYANLYHELLAL